MVPANAPPPRHNMDGPTPRQSFAQSTATFVSTHSHSQSRRPDTPTTASRSSLTSSSILSDANPKRQQRPKEKQFAMKNGHKHHTFDPEKAPYPVAYDRSTLELEGLDVCFQKHLTGQVSLVPALKEQPPERVLDLGCGSGSWVINAAKEWPKCDIVGFDLVDVQIPVHILKDPAFSRISWVHGNFLTTRLPFDDDEFDHVHIKDIARGVPETKWDFVFAEVCRVLQPGGSIEVIEDDMIFPVLPRWFTSPLRARVKRTQSMHYPSSGTNGHRQSSSVSKARPPPPTRSFSDDGPTHDHALLEALYASVFENRFINMRPTSLLPVYLTTYFRQVHARPAVHFPMPPVAPPPPLPRPASPSTSTVDMLNAAGLASPPAVRPQSLSFSSTQSAGSATIANSVFTTQSAGTSLFTSESVTLDSHSVAESHKDLSNSRKRSLSTPHAGHFALSAEEPISGFAPQSRVLFYRGTQGENVTSEDMVTGDLTDLSERSLAMQLWRSFLQVMGTQEAMWQELKDWLRNKHDQAKALGWDDDGDEPEGPAIRLKFEALLETYREDMQTRVSLWCSLADLGWELPPKEPLSKAEHNEEERIHCAIKEAMKSATVADMQAPCRSVRVMIGYKSLDTPRYP